MPAFHEIEQDRTLDGRFGGLGDCHRDAHVRLLSLFGNLGARGWPFRYSCM
jgi:hypothetical protein